MDKYQEIQQKHVNRFTVYLATSKHLTDQIDAWKMKIIRLERRMRRLEVPFLKDTMIMPIAQELEVLLPEYKCVVYGPFGLTCRFTICLFERKAEKLELEEMLASIELRPDSDIASGKLLYKTGEVIDEYPKNSLGEINGMNYVTAPVENLSTIVNFLLAQIKPRNSE